MDKVYQDKPTLCEVLREKVKDYKRAHPRFSSSQIARKWGLSSSSLNRIENMDIKTPTIDQAIKVLRGCGSNEEIVEFIKSYYPEIHESLFSFYIETSKTNELDESLEKYFQDPSTYKMMLLASTKGGLSEQYILHEYGRSGHKLFMKLAADGLIINKNGRFFTKGPATYLDAVSSIKAGTLLMDELSSKLIVTGEVPRTDFRIIYENVNVSKVKDQVNSLVEEYYFEIKKILKDPENNGDETLVSSVLLTVLDQEIK